MTNLKLVSNVEHGVAQLVLVGLCPAFPEPEVRRLPVLSFDHAMAVISEGLELGEFVPAWIEADGLIVASAGPAWLAEMQKKKTPEA